MATSNNKDNQIQSSRDHFATQKMGIYKRGEGGLHQQTSKDTEQTEVQNLMEVLTNFYSSQAKLNTISGKHYQSTQ